MLLLEQISSNQTIRQQQQQNPFVTDLSPTSSEPGVQARPSRDMEVSGMRLSVS